MIDTRHTTDEPAETRMRLNYFFDDDGDGMTRLVAFDGGLPHAAVFLHKLIVEVPPHRLQHLVAVHAAILNGEFAGCDHSVAFTRCIEPRDPQAT